MDNYVGNPRGCAKFGANPPIGGFWANGWNITNFFKFLPIFGIFRQTRRRIFTLNGSNDSDSRKGVPFGGFVDIDPHFWCEILQSPQFGGVNRLFQAELAKYWVSYYRNYCIDLNQILHDDTDHQVVNVGDSNKRPTNPRWRWPPSWKSQK